MPIRKQPAPNADHHVHSTFSDGRGTLEENLAAALASGLNYLGFVDHVRSASDWLPEYVARVSAVSRTSPIRVTCGVEAKILDTEGRLDLPRELAGIHRIVAADHQVPTPRGPRPPTEVREALDAGTVSSRWVVDTLVDATSAAMRRRHGLLIAHLFSLLPKLGMTEDDVSDEHVHRLAEAASRTGALLEVSERWRCPSLRVVRVFFEAGVEVVASSDAHEPAAVGRFDYVASVLSALTPRLVRSEVA